MTLWSLPEPRGLELLSLSDQGGLFMCECVMLRWHKLCFPTANVIDQFPHCLVLQYHMCHVSHFKREIILVSP